MDNVRTILFFFFLHVVLTVDWLIPGTTSTTMQSMLDCMDTIIGHLRKKSMAYSVHAGGLSSLTTSWSTVPWG